MNENLRRRRAAHLLRERAADALEQASELDGWPILHLTVADEAKIADALGISIERLHQAVETLMPANDDTDAWRASCSACGWATTHHTYAAAEDAARAHGDDCLDAETTVE